METTPLYIKDLDRASFDFAVAKLSPHDHASQPAEHPNTGPKAAAHTPRSARVAALALAIPALALIVLSGLALRPPASSGAASGGRVPVAETTPTAEKALVLVATFTSAPVPTETPSPEATLTPSATSTSTPEPSPTPLPSETPLPTVTATMTVAPAPPPPPPPPPKTATPRPAFVLYVVRTGDNLSSIAARYRVSVAAIQAANGLRNTLIYARQTLKIPITR
jgi:LysM repeat protein